MEQHPREKVQVKPEGPPGLFQGFSQHVIEIKGKNHEKIAGLGRLDDKGHHTPHLPPKDCRHIQAQILIIELRHEQLEHQPRNIEYDDVIHQIVDSISAKFTF